MRTRREPAQRGPLLFDDFTVVAKYGSEYRGFVQYYLPAQDVFRRASCAGSWRPPCSSPWPGSTSPPSQMTRKYKATIDTGAGSQDLLPGHRRARRQEAAGRPLRRDPAQAAAHRRHHRPETAPGHRQAERADPSAPCRSVRDLPVADRTASPLRPQARRSGKAGAARPAGPDRLDGQAQAQDSCGLRTLPPGHPRRTRHSHHPEVEHWRAGCGDNSPVRFGKGPLLCPEFARTEGSAA